MPCLMPIRVKVSHFDRTLIIGHGGRSKNLGVVQVIIEGHIRKKVFFFLSGLKLGSDKGSSGPPSLLCNGVFADISWESRCNIEINFRAHLFEILLVFEVPYRTKVKGMPEKS